jgi:hypothetical protein
VIDVQHKHRNLFILNAANDAIGIYPIFPQAFHVEPIAFTKTARVFVGSDALPEKAQNPTFCLGA